MKDMVRTIFSLAAFLVSIVCHIVRIGWVLVATGFLLRVAATALLHADYRRAAAAAIGLFLALTITGFIPGLIIYSVQCRSRLRAVSKSRRPSPPAEPASASAEIPCLFADIANLTTNICHRCGRSPRKRKGPFDWFFGRSGYPHCTCAGSKN